jgi:4-amino-4-deoxy-L-arabinose transferase-like glycosyltransferase
MKIDRAAMTVLAVLMVALFAAIVMLPALPVDETRYLTVAWEMRATGNWSLPTLNFAPYSHKPPLLFWLINASWSLFGLEIWPTRLIGALSMLCVLTLTNALDRRLAPSTERAPAVGSLLLLSLPLFVTLGFSIMFDMLLTATVSAAMLALWIAGRTGDRRAFAVYGLCVGLGILAKGPVVLLFALPPTLLASAWTDPPQRRGWTLRIALSLALALAIGLAWALRAAYLGGPEFAEMLFWKQSAGRIASSFAHARPVWFYVPILALFLTPVLLWRPAWQSLTTRAANEGSARNFLLAWLLPPLIGLSLISGKQIHYLLPLLPAVALLSSLGLRHVIPRPADRYPLIAVAGLTTAALVATALGWLDWLPEGALETAASELSIPLVVLTGVIAVGAIAMLGGTVRRSLLGLAIANLAVLTSLAVQSRETVQRLFDLQPVADVIASHRDHPIAVTQTRGEFGFLARLRQPLVDVPEADLPCWLARHPESIAVVRKKPGEQKLSLSHSGVRHIYERNYRIEEAFAVLAATPGHTPAGCAP